MSNQDKRFKLPPMLTSAKEGINLIAVSNNTDVPLSKVVYSQVSLEKWMIDYKTELSDNLIDLILAQSIYYLNEGVMKINLVVVPAYRGQEETIYYI